MLRPLEFAIGLRYTRAKRRNHFISFISLASMLGITIGVMALITVLSVMNGFEKELRARILGVVAHATVSGPGNLLAGWPDVAKTLRDIDGVAGVAPYIQGQAMMVNGKHVSGGIIRGVLPNLEGEVSNVGEKMVKGSLDELRAGDFSIILGRELAAALRVGVGDKVMLIIPQTTVTPVGTLPRLRRFTVTGIFEVGMYEYDSALAIVHIADAARLYQTNDAVSGLRLRLTDLFAAPRIAAEIRNTLPFGHRVMDWTQQHANFFRAVRMEKMVMSIILFLIVSVAAFNLVSTLVMMVTDKQGDVAILRTMGVSPGSIMAIFVVQGAIIGLVGTLAGVFFGVALATHIDTVVPAIEQFFGVHFLAADVYYISELPSDMRWEDVTGIAGITFALCLLATLYPAWRAAGTHPAEALRYE
ncbi:MAG: lipoprotein-releasing ABC transporter permease subunit [Gammaproteobacteria bacterium]|nr:lipoprotein-releasing ABC transporter permease subunit [Gammaproteobacteria bacterium]